MQVPRRRWKGVRGRMRGVVWCGLALPCSTLPAMPMPMPMHWSGRVQLQLVRGAGAECRLQGSLRLP